MGKSGLCSHCDKERIARLAQPKSKKPLYLALGAVALAAVVALVLIFTLGGGETETPTEPSQTPTEPVETTSGEPSISGKHHVQIDIRDYGTISVELDADAAPITVENFLKLANEGKTILLNTQEIPEIQRVADRCVVFYSGKIAKILDHAEITEHSVMMYATNAIEVVEDVKA